MSIEDFIEVAEREVKRWTVTQIGHNLQVKFGLAAAPDTIRLALHTLGFVWGPTKKIGKKYVKEGEAERRMRKLRKLRTS